MASFIHITDARNAASIRRNGLKPQPAPLIITASPATQRFVYCVPVVADFAATFQWLGELRRKGYRSSIAVQFRVADGEEVFIGKFSGPHRRATAAEAAGLYMKHPDPRGLEVLLPRPVRVGEITRIRDMPKAFGWRYSPTARITFFGNPGLCRVKSRRRKLVAAQRRKRKAAWRERVA